MAALSKSAKIAVLGAGVFGLSTALHLLESGYTDVTIYDKQDFNETEYSPFAGAESASSDTMKVCRSAYGNSPLLQALANESIAEWRRWNKDSAQELFVNCGWARLTDLGQVQPIDLATIKTMTDAGMGHTQYVLSDEKDTARAEKDGWGGIKLDQFRRREKNLPLDGVLDASAGYTAADIACKYALSVVKANGGKVVLGEEDGKWISFNYDTDSETGKRVVGFNTKNGRVDADLTIVAAGPYSPGMVTGLSQFVTATAGNFIHIEVPEDLRKNYTPDVFPVWAWNYTGNSESGGLTGFPIDRHGTLKISYRSPKWTNPVRDPSTSKTTSVPALGVDWTPLMALDGTKTFIRENMPELVGAKILKAKMCWYTDTVDLDFVVDYPPDVKGLFVATGGSGHGFKFLPVLGKYVVQTLEGKAHAYSKMWRWRQPTADETAGIRSSEVDPKKVWSQQVLARDIDFQW